ncbi:hypothetical protein EYZ11_006679 [Aspergillus tanneri]|uniref:Uncharacterized protein n=1 Tax=Aspergillus tanneri TaxID=1220188 RepID=A0A4S3JH39_9EURO|nr:uncharacterized protein ATNIH1004_009386 [Aspergillus tanneri]KAA8645169.1 hypothetical protein ATNIH1004_009386 [Aspergillus tanneri]THC93827.1 hypothetical protein EYZ11_006679 [Aspergillus tanneri]
MAWSEKIKSMLAAFAPSKKATSRPEDQSASEAGPQRRQISWFHDEEWTDDDSYDALTEIAVPEPVERHHAEDLRSRPSLEQRLSSISHSNPDAEAACGALSEVATPEPVERLSEEELRHHPSLEKRLSSASHHHRRRRSSGGSAPETRAVE